MSESKGSRWKPVTISVLLFTVLCFAGFFAGFRYGQSAGTDQRVEQLLEEREQAAKKLTVTRVYRVTDLIGHETMEELSAAIAGWIPRRYQAEGRTMAVAGEDSIIVGATSAELDIVTAYLEGRRDGMKISARSREDSGM